MEQQETDKVAPEGTPAKVRKKSTWWLWVLFACVGLAVVIALAWPRIEKSFADNIEIVVLSDSVRFERVSSRESDEDSGGFFGSLTRRLTGDLVVSMEAKVTNDNFVGIQIDGVTYEISMNNKVIGDGKAVLPKGGLEVGSGESKRVVIKTRFSIADTAMAQIGTVFSSEFGMQVGGVVTARAPLMTLKRRFKVAGLKPVINLSK